MDTTTLPTPTPPTPPTTSSSSSSSSPHQPFHSYTPSQARLYAAARTGYSPALYRHVLAQHAATGGQTGLLLDVGCGPGTVTGDLAAYFDRAVGCDPGEEMIAVARGRKVKGRGTGKEKGGGEEEDKGEGKEEGGEGEDNAIRSRNGEKVAFWVCKAEELDRLDEMGESLRGKVDLIVCGMSAHFFDMPTFYRQAARVLRPGGSLAMWACGSFCIHPRSTPKAAEVQAVINEFENVTLAPYAKRSSHSSADLYDNLPLPWDVDGNDSLQKAFDRDQLHRMVWNRGGKLRDHEDDFLAGTKTASLTMIKYALGTSATVTRWREANAHLAKGDGDCVEVMIGKIRDILGVTKEDEGKVTLQTGSATGLIILKRT